ncbi:MAG: hypothetical protein IKG39_10685 [Lachnospiraceae bacterium]|nr:hypothetical protein [Lachnospiraceae bacterium]
MITANAELREYMRQKNIPYWKLAKELGVAESTLIRWLREELPDITKQTYLRIVEEIVEKGE